MRAGAFRPDDSRSPAEADRLRERTILEELIELHPERLTISELILRVARDPEKADEVDAIRRGVRDLRCSGLVRYGGDEIVEPTHAALSAYDLFLGA